MQPAEQTAFTSLPFCLLSALYLMLCLLRDQSNQLLRDMPLRSKPQPAALILIDNSNTVYDMHRIELAGTDTTAKAHTAIAAGLISTAGDQSCLSGSRAYRSTETSSPSCRRYRNSEQKLLSALSPLLPHRESYRSLWLPLHLRKGRRSEPPYQLRWLPHRHHIRRNHSRRSYFLRQIHAPGSLCHRLPHRISYRPHREADR